MHGLTPGDLRRVFAAMDMDASGTVSCAEFIEAVDATPYPLLQDKVIL